MSESRISTATLALLDNMKNEDIIWHGTFIGLTPELRGSTLSLQETSENITPYLIDALLDEEKFVAAHVLLAFRSPISVTCDGDVAKVWCGLKVQIDAVDGTTFRGNNLRKLQCDWRKTLGQ